MFIPLYFLDQILVLLEHGIELKSIENDLGKSLLRMAISENDLFDEKSLERKIQILLSQEAKFHPTPSNEDSELMWALKRRFFRIANYFIANRADVNHIGENGNTVLHLICKGLCVLKKNKIEMCWYYFILRRTGLLLFTKKK